MVMPQYTGIVAPTVTGPLAAGQLDVLPEGLVKYVYDTNKHKVLHLNASKPLKID